MSKIGKRLNLSWPWTLLALKLGLPVHRSLSKLWAYIYVYSLTWKVTATQIASCQSNSWKKPQTTIQFLSNHFVWSTMPEPDHEIVRIVAILAEMYWSTFLPRRGTRRNLVRGGSTPRSNPLPFYIPFLTETCTPSDVASPYRQLWGVSPGFHFLSSFGVIPCLQASSLGVKASQRVCLQAMW